MPDMTYQLQSLSLSIVTVGIVTFLSFAPAFLRFGDEFRAAMRSWLLGTALVVASDVLTFLNFDVSYAKTVLLVIAGIGVAEWTHAIHLYSGKTRRRRWPYIAILLAAIVSLVFPSDPGSVLVSSILFALLYFGAAASAASIHEPESSIGRALLVTIFSVIALATLGSLGFFVFGTTSGASPGVTTMPRAVAFTIASIGPIAGTFAFVLTCGERFADRLLNWSLTDSLTGIPNRRAFLYSLEQALSSSDRRSEPLTVLVIDVDQFERVNESAGREAGDQVLIRIAKIIEHESRTEDTVGRIGGEEFGVVVPKTDMDSAIPLAERLGKAVAAAPISIDGLTFDVTVSVGITTFADKKESATNIIARVDGFLHDFKNRGSSRVVKVEPPPSSTQPVS